MLEHLGLALAEHDDTADLAHGGQADSTLLSTRSDIEPTDQCVLGVGELVEGDRAGLEPLVQ
ncbi:MAG TPA: hypothetical protein VFT09_12635, partial [Ilumatobacteraceae bacterium]|nr:hypothetical protein [Ilumatobacteraceae bacterium]